MRASAPAGLPRHRVPVPALPTPAQQAVLRDHRGHARYVWNLAVEQHARWRPGRRNAPGYLEQCRQLTAARAEDNPVLRDVGRRTLSSVLEDQRGSVE